MYILLDKDNYVTAVSDSKLKNGIKMDLPDDFKYEYQNCYRLENNALVYDSSRELEYKKSELRAQRKDILTAFDIYKTNVNFGIEKIETDLDKILILAWYQDLLDLKETAFENIPEAIQKYV